MNKDWEEKLLKEWSKRIKVKDGFTSLDSAHIGTWLIPFIRSQLLQAKKEVIEEIRKELCSQDKYEEWNNAYMICKDILKFLDALKSNLADTRKK